MARTYATVGQMITYAYEQVLRSRSPEQRADSEAMFVALAAFQLEYLCMAPRSRSALIAAAIGEPIGVGNVVAAETADPRRADLSARILPPAGEDDDGATLLIALGVGRPVPPDRIQRLLTRLGSCQRSRLLLVAPKAYTSAIDASIDSRIRLITWEKMRKRVVKDDPAHAELWASIADIGTTAGLPIAQLPVDPYAVLNDADIAREFHEHLLVFHSACRAALGISPRFSTQAGERYAHLQAGASRGRWGLRFGEVFNGTPVIVMRGHDFVHPLGVALPETAADHQAVADFFAQFRARNDDRRGTPPKLRPMIGAPASAHIEAARRLLWSVLNPALLAERDFVLAPARQQPALTRTTLSMRLLHRGDPDGISYLIRVGNAKEWQSLIPHVVREETPELEAESYAVAPRRGWSSAQFVWEVHRVLHSLTVAVRKQAAQ